MPHFLSIFAFLASVLPFSAFTTYLQGQTITPNPVESGFSESGHSEMAVDWKNDEAKLRRGLAKSNEFRRELLDGDAKTIGAALETFRTTLQVPQDRPNLQGFKVTPEMFVSQVEAAEPLDASNSFAPFSGRWYGEWNKKLVDHNWSEVFIPGELTDISSQQTLGSRLALQYAWIGDGFGWNLLVQPKGARGQTILGYVYHIKSHEPNEVQFEFPLVGYSDGPGRVIWVTPSSCYFEEVHDQPNEHYSITGFNFKLKEGVLHTDGSAFQAVYTRDPKRRPKWIEFAFPPLDRHDAQSDCAKR